MRQICINAAKVLNVTVFGGECIVGEDGTIKIIDFNDWPSFAPCRESASSYIAECIYKNFAPYLNKKTSQELLKKDGSAC